MPTRPTSFQADPTRQEEFSSSSMSRRYQETWGGNMLPRNPAIGYASWMVIFTSSFSVFCPPIIPKSKY